MLTIICNKARLVSQFLSEHLLIVCFANLMYASTWQLLWW